MTLSLYRAIESPSAVSAVRCNSRAAFYFEVMP